MTELEKLRKLLESELPSARLTVEFPARNRQTGWLDIVQGNSTVVVEWRLGKGFGISLLNGRSDQPTQGLFEGPDEICRGIPETRDRVLSLLDPPRQRAAAARS